MNRYVRTTGEIIGRITDKMVNVNGELPAVSSLCSESPSEPEYDG